MMAAEMPGRMARLPRDHTGRPVPWFVWWDGDRPDFRVIGKRKPEDAVRHKLCWVCGCPFQRQEHRAFVVGPMCAVNRLSSEPPSHIDCAAYSAVMCPFLSRPQMVRRERGMDEFVEPAGVMITRNPGVAVVWVTKYNAWHWRNAPTRDGKHTSLLFDIGEPAGVRWYHRGRPATREEILAAIDSGLPSLQAAAEADEQRGLAALGELERELEIALTLVPE